MKFALEDFFGRGVGEPSHGLSNFISSTSLFFLGLLRSLAWLELDHGMVS